MTEYLNSSASITQLLDTLIARSRFADISQCATQEYNEYSENS